MEIIKQKFNIFLIRNGILENNESRNLFLNETILNNKDLINFISLILKIKINKYSSNLISNKIFYNYVMKDNIKLIKLLKQMFYIYNKKIKNEKLKYFFYWKLIIYKLNNENFIAYNNEINNENNKEYNFNNHNRNIRNNIKTKILKSSLSENIVNKNENIYIKKNNMYFNSHSNNNKIVNENQILILSNHEIKNNIEDNNNLNKKIYKKKSIEKYNSKDIKYNLSNKINNSSKNLSNITKESNLSLKINNKNKNLTKNKSNKSVKSNSSNLIGKIKDNFLINLENSNKNKEIHMKKLITKENNRLNKIYTFNPLSFTKNYEILNKNYSQKLFQIPMNFNNEKENLNENNNDILINKKLIGIESKIKNYINNKNYSKIKDNKIKNIQKKIDEEKGISFKPKLNKNFNKIVKKNFFQRYNFYLRNKDNNYIEETITDKECTFNPTINKKYNKNNVSFFQRLNFYKKIYDNNIEKLKEQYKKIYPFQPNIPNNFFENNNINLNDLKKNLKKHNKKLLCDSKNDIKKVNLNSLNSPEQNIITSFKIKKSNENDNIKEKYYYINEKMKKENNEFNDIINKISFNNINSINNSNNINNNNIDNSEFKKMKNNKNEKNKEIKNYNFYNNNFLIDEISQQNKFFDNNLNNFVKFNNIDIKLMEEANLKLSEDNSLDNYIKKNNYNNDN